MYSKMVAIFELLPLLNLLWPTWGSCLTDIWTYDAFTAQSNNPRVIIWSRLGVVLLYKHGCYYFIHAFIETSSSSNCVKCRGSLVKAWNMIFFIMSPFLWHPKSKRSTKNCIICWKGAVLQMCRFYLVVVLAWEQSSSNAMSTWVSSVHHS